MKKLLILSFLFISHLIHSQVLCGDGQYPCVQIQEDGIKRVVMTHEQANKVYNTIQSNKILEKIIEAYQEDSIMYVSIIELKDSIIDNYKVKIELFDDIISSYKGEINHLNSMKSILIEIEKVQQNKIKELKRKNRNLRWVSGGAITALVIILIL